MTGRWTGVLRAVLLDGQRLSAMLPAPVRTTLRGAFHRTTFVGDLVGLPGWGVPLVMRKGANGLDGMATAPALPTRQAVEAPAMWASKPGPRCLIVTSSLDVGGMDAFVAFLARGLTGMHWDVAVFVTPSAHGHSTAGRLAEQLQRQGIPVAVHDERSGPEAIRRLEPDVCSVHGAPDWAVAAVADAGVPVVETLHGMHTLFAAGPEAIERRATRLQGVVAVSPLMRVQYLEACPSFDPSRVVTVPNGVLSCRVPLHVREAARRALGLDGEFLFVSLARHCLQKNTYGLAAAFGQVAARAPSAHLVIAGRPDDAAYAAQVMRLKSKMPAGERLHLRDHVDDPRLLLAAADGFVMNSFFEGWSLASMEALTAGVPVVLADVAGAREQLDAIPRPGVLVANPLGHPHTVSWGAISASRFRVQANREELVGAMVDMVADRSRWAALRDQIAVESEERFSPAVCLRRHADILAAAQAKGSWDPTTAESRDSR